MKLDSSSEINTYRIYGDQLFIGNNAIEVVDITNFNLSLQIDTKSNVNSIVSEGNYLLLG